MEKRIGIIDIGSNSVHLVVGSVREDQFFYIIDDVKVNVRLCENLSETGMLQEERMVYGVETLRMYAEMAKSYAIDEIICVATAAVRKAENGKIFVQRVKEASGIDIQIISGEREAELDYLGAINTLDIRDALLIDIGGGSAEFVLIKEREKINQVSLSFGSIDLKEKFNLGDKVSDKDLNALKHFLEKAYAEIDFLEEAKGLPIIGVGGTIRNLGRMHRRLVDYPLAIAHNYQMTQDEVKKICKKSAAEDLEGRLNIKGLSKGRADIFVGASFALQVAMETIESDKLIISEAGLRDGMAFDFLGYYPGHLINDILERSLLKILRHYDGNLEHGRHMYLLVQKLYYELAPLHQLTLDTRKMLRTATMLHDIGIIVGYRDHHEHSFYLMLNSGVEGISHKELLIAAFIALNHRTNKKIKVDDCYLNLLSKEDEILIDKLSLFLQIAEYLDRSMDSYVKDLKCYIQEDYVEIMVYSNGHSVFEDMIIEECGRKFQRVYRKELRIKNNVYKVQ